MQKKYKCIFIFGFCFAVASFGGGFLLGYKIATAGLSDGSSEDTDRVELIEDSIERTVQSLEISQEELIQLRQEIKMLKLALTELKTRVQELNRRLAKLKMQNKILIGAVVTLSLTVLGFGIYEGIKNKRR